MNAYGAVKKNKVKPHREREVESSLNLLSKWRLFECEHDRPSGSGDIISPIQFLSLMNRSIFFLEEIVALDCSLQFGPPIQRQSFKFEGWIIRKTRKSKFHSRCEKVRIRNSILFIFT